MGGLDYHYFVSTSHVVKLNTKQKSIEHNTISHSRQPTIVKFTKFLSWMILAFSYLTDNDKKKLHFFLSFKSIKPENISQIHNPSKNTWYMSLFYVMWNQEDILFYLYFPHVFMRLLSASGIYRLIQLYCYLHLQL